jgi:response regulator NasT
MRAIIISSGGYLDKRIERLLINYNIKGDVATKLTRNMINVYDCVIFSYKNDILNLPKVIEGIALEKKMLVIYVNNTDSIGYYYNLIDDLYFVMINESTLDIELPVVIKTNAKYIKRINSLKIENIDLKEQLKLFKLTNKAKRVLIEKGLTEDESHKFIQQKSMSMRISKLKVVNLIIENKIDF